MKLLQLKVVFMIFWILFQKETELSNWNPLLSYFIIDENGTLIYIIP